MAARGHDTADDDEGEADGMAGGKRLVQANDAEHDGDRGVEVGDDDRARRADFFDELEERPGTPRRCTRRESTATHCHVSLETWWGQCTSAHGNQHERHDRGRSHDDRGPGYVLELRGEDDRSERVADAHQQHEADPREVPPVKVETDEEGHADGADGEAEVAPRRDVVFGSTNALERRPKRAARSRSEGW